MAARLGLPYAFASHFAPRMMMQAITLYREYFQPSQYLDQPYVMLGVPSLVAETDDEAQFLATTQQQRILSLLRGRPFKLCPPVESMDELWSPAEKLGVQNFLAVAKIGSAATVKRELEDFLAETQADELIFTCDVYDPQKRLDSFSRLMQLKQSLSL